MAAVACLLPFGAQATQVPVRIESDDAACDPKRAPQYQERLLHISVNGTDAGAETMFLQRPCGALLARQKDLEALRIKTRGKPVVEINGEKYLDLNAYPGLTFAIDPEQQRVAFEGEPAVFYPTVLNLERNQPPPAQAPKPGGFLNYGLFASGNNADNGDHSYSGTLGAGVFGEPGVLTSDWLWSRFGDVDNTYRIATTFTHDDEARIATLRVGDVYARSGSFGSGAPLAGVQYGSNFALRPGMITTPVQMMEAATRSSAGLDLYSYDAGDPEHTSRAAFLSGLTTAPHGPVELINIPTYDNGEYQMVLRDRFGREVTVRQEYFFNQGLLRQGLDDYSVEAGVQRAGGLGNHYQGSYGSGTWRHGQSSTFTRELHAEGSGDGYAAGAGGSWAIPWWGVLDVTLAGSQSDIVDGIGAYGAAGLENRYHDFAYALRADCRDTRFHLPTETAPVNPTACREFAVLSGTLPWRGDGASLSLSNTDQRLGPDIRTARLAYSTHPLPGSQLQVYAGWTDAGAQSVNGGLIFNLAFGAAGVGVPGKLFDARRTNFNLLANSDSQSNTTAFGRVSTGTGPSDNAVGLQAGAALDGRDLETLSGTWSGSRAVAVAGLSNAQSTTTWTVGGASALAFMDGGVFASRPLYNSFALVRLGPDYGGVRVNDLHTNGDGDLLISPLQAYYENPISLNAGDLPVNARVDTMQYEVRPRFRSGVVLHPSIQPARDALLTVELTDTQGARVPLPPGAYARVPGTDEPFPVGEDGLLYVSGLDDKAQITVHYREQECRLQLTLPAHPPANTTPELGTFLCEGVTP